MFTAWQQCALIEAPVSTLPWYRDSLVAFDSQIFILNGSNRFTDYSGNMMQARNNAFGVSGSLPTVASGTVTPYGPGIQMDRGSAIHSIAGSIAGDIFSKSYTLDFWYKQENTVAAIPLYFNIAYPSIAAGGSVTNRFFIGAYDAQSAYLAIWNNAAAPRAIAATTHNLQQTAWTHVAIVYDDSTQVTTVYKNGVATNTMSLKVDAVVNSVEVGVANTTSATKSTIERYRIRSGVRFTGSFNPSLIY